MASPPSSSVLLCAACSIISVLTQWILFPLFPHLPSHVLLFSPSFPLSFHLSFLPPFRLFFFPLPPPLSPSLPLSPSFPLSFFPPLLPPSFRLSVFSSFLFLLLFRRLFPSLLLSPSPSFPLSFFPPLLPPFLSFRLSIFSSLLVFPSFLLNIQPGYSSSSTLRCGTPDLLSWSCTPDRLVFFLDSSSSSSLVLFSSTRPWCTSRVRVVILHVRSPPPFFFYSDPAHSSAPEKKKKEREKKGGVGGLPPTLKLFSPLSPTI